MAVRLVERAAELDLSLPEDLLQRLQAWFSEVTETETQTREREAGAEAEAGITAPPLIRSVLKLGASVKGAAKFSSARTTENVRKRLQRISELVDLSNHLYQEANRLLLDAHRREWVFLVEDLDKSSVSPDVLDSLFVQYSNIWSELRVHFVCTIPLWLAFGEKGNLLPLPCRTIVDIPIFDQQHCPHEPGRQILRSVLAQRVDSSLFAEGVLERLIEAGGGHFRDTFAVVTEAASLAELSGLSRIEAPQATRAINWLRNQYMRRLGTTGGEDAIPYEEKA